MRISKPLFWLLTFIWFLLAIWWYHCSSCSSCHVEEAKVISTDPKIPTPPGFLVEDGTWKTSSSSNILFPRSSNLPTIPPEVMVALDSVVAHSNLNKRTLAISGYYSPKENNFTDFDDVGIARAEEIKKLLVAKGIPPSQISTQGVLSESIFFTPKDTLIGVIQIGFGAETIVPPSKEEAEKKLLEPRTIYFGTGQPNIPMTPQLLDYLKRAEAYISEHPEVKLTVTGHTDNVGDADKNMRLSLARAAFAKSILTENGIKATNIETYGKGQTEPIESNDNEDGRAKNRRVTIKLQ